MPNIKTSEKAMRQSARRQKRNQKRKEGLKGVLKTYKKLVTQKKGDEAKKYLSEVYKKIDKSAKVKLIKKNKASRLKSKFSKLTK